MTFLHKLIFIAAAAALFSCSQPGETYYVDGENGADSNTGLRPDQAWASLDRVNQQTFEPGDKILFKSGSVFQGQLKPQGSGSAEHPVVIDEYGDGDRPRIDGKGMYKSTVWLYNVQHWEVNNLEITNTGGEREAGRRGVTIEARDFGDCNHIYLNNLFIHDVNGSLVKSEGGGSAVLWSNGGDSIKTRFVDLKIENCHLLRCERNGINSRGYTRRSEWHPSTGVVIRNNLLEQIPGDGIVPIGCDGAVIEHNIMRDCPDILSHEEAAAGIWPWSSDNTLIQYNEVSGHNAKWDGQGFDSDWNCQNTIIQYNYSHDNAGGFLLICNNGANIGSDGNIGTTNTIVRYNISVNDGLRAYPTKRRGFFSPTFHISGPAKGSKIYNNIIYVPKKPNDSIDRTIVEMDNWGGPWPVDTYFANNIFYTCDSADFQWGRNVTHTFMHNLFYGAFAGLPDDPERLHDDPLFTDPAKAGAGFESLDGFKLKNGSPAIDAGIHVDQEILNDFFGNKVDADKPVSIGFYETPGN